jgi:dihydroorotate dehydrogenase
LIELYSALVFHGLQLIATIKSELSDALRRDRRGGTDELVGVDARALTAQSWPV